MWRETNNRLGVDVLVLMLDLLTGWRKTDIDPYFLGHVT